MSRRHVAGGVRRPGTRREHRLERERVQRHLREFEERQVAWIREYRPGVDPRLAKDPMGRFLLMPPAEAEYRARLRAGGYVGPVIEPPPSRSWVSTEPVRATPPHPLLLIVAAVMSLLAGAALAWLLFA